MIPTTTSAAMNATINASAPGQVPLVGVRVHPVRVPVPTTVGMAAAVRLFAAVTVVVGRVGVAVPGVVGVLMSVRHRRSAVPAVVGGQQPSVHASATAVTSTSVPFVGVPLIAVSVGAERSGAQQVSPCQASRPSFTATAAMTSAAIGSAQDHPNSGVQPQPDQQHRGQVGAQQGLLGVGHRGAGAEFPASASLPIGQERHHQQADRRQHQADDGRPGLADPEQRADGVDGDVAGEGEERERDDPQCASSPGSPDP